MKNIAIFASGSGSNAENLVKYFEGHDDVRIVMMACNRKNALVFERMNRLNIPSYYISKEDFENGNLLNLLLNNQIDWIVLAGFLKLVPEQIIKSFPNKIVNIHPALLPKYGGKGMYGKHVHDAVIEAGELKTGITIHYVNENFDEGKIIAQYETKVLPDDTVETVAAKIHELEMMYFPKVVDKLINFKK
jgi:phosphoribosylglycinamide formyltransferase-1